MAKAWPVEVIGHVLSASPLFVAVLASFFLGVGELGLSWGNLVGVLPIIIGVWSVANFFFEIVEYRSRGEPGWPALSMETLASARAQMGVFFAGLAVLLAVGYYMLVTAGWAQVSQVYAAVVAIELPAIAALLAVSRDIFRALNPFFVLRVIARIGALYLLCLLASLALIGLFLFAYVSPGFVSFFVVVYGALLLAYLLGSVLYARRRQLGVYAPRAPEMREERDYRERLARRQSALTRAYSFAARGNKRGAIADIESYLQGDDDTLEARLWVFNELTRWEDPATALVYGGQLIETLEAAELHSEAAKVRTVCEYLRRD